MNVIRKGNTLSLTSAISIDQEVPVGIYDVGFDPNIGFTLHVRPGFAMPEKIYGGHDTFATRTLTTFAALNRGMGVLLSGPKGCGKTLTAKRIAMDSGLPVLCLPDPFLGGVFVEFLTELPNRCVIFIDEFEKLYREREHRAGFLTVLDGCSDNKHLFVLTSNEQDIGEYFNNRPGRIRYHRKYTDLPKEILIEMIEDKMEEGHLRDAVKEFVMEIGAINPDGLVSLIQECLMHNEVPADFISYFNITDDITGAYDVVLETDGFSMKKGLTKPQKEGCKTFLNYVKNYGIEEARGDYGEFEKYLEASRETWSAQYCRVFKRRFDRTSNNGYWFICDWLSKNGEYGNCKQVRLTERDILSVKREHGAVIIETHSGDKLTCTPSASFGRSYNPTDCYDD